MKLLIALALAAAPSALALAPYIVDDTAAPSASPTKDPTAAPTPTCEPCADVVTLDDHILGPSTVLELFPDNKCYEVKGTFPSGGIEFPEEVNCAKLTVPSDSRLNGIRAASRVLFLTPRPTNDETLRAQVRGDNVEIVNEGTVSDIDARLPRPLLLLARP